jgi:hypothetical protein
LSPAERRLAAPVDVLTSIDCVEYPEPWTVRFEVVLEGLRSVCGEERVRAVSWTLVLGGA